MVEDIAREHPGQPIELWFQDEMRVGQKGTLTRVWAAKGERATAPRDLRFGYAYLFGAVCPVRDTGAAIVMPMVNTIAMNEHLIEIGRCVSPGAHAVLILDGAGWHPREGLAVPANITLLFLPTYSPELNPVEELWHELLASSTPSKTSSRPAAMPGTPPCTSPASSNPSPDSPGCQRSLHYDFGISLPSFTRSVRVVRDKLERTSVISAPLAEAGRGGRKRQGTSPLTRPRVCACGKALAATHAALLVIPQRAFTGEEVRQPLDLANAGS